MKLAIFDFDGTLQKFYASSCDKHAKDSLHIFINMI